MSGAEENPSFLEFILSSNWKFYQERTLPLDLFHSGYLGVSVACLAIASITVFLLAMFHIIPSRKHTILLLLSLGVLTLGLGVTTSWLNFRGLPDNVEELVRKSAGNDPSVDEDVAAVYALPLAIGSAAGLFNVLALSYLAVFWGAKAGSDDSRANGKSTKKRRRR